MKVVLDVTNVTKAFGNRVAVNNISFTLHEGEIFGFLGPNGAGKTTTMKMICGLCSITKGSIRICGFDMPKDKEKALANVGALIENPLMYPNMSGMDNLKYYASLYKNIKTEDILKYSKVVGLEHRLKDKVKTYSLGMKQRLGIAQALLHSPKLLILDEPLSGLDPNGVKEMRDFLKTLAKEYNIAILISSHMLSDMEQICDTIGIINNGQLLEIRSMNSLKESAEGSSRIQIKVDYPNFAGKIIVNELQLRCELAGNKVLVFADESRINDITQKLVGYGISIFGIEIVSKSLEEIFLDIINLKTKGKTSIV
ncbi:MAG: ABC transporter ATP-binding protein [Eubacteriales bacterium]|nr:ABC transporter ATP-binding protein [Eubacteriales bacterium]